MKDGGSRFHPDLHNEIDLKALSGRASQCLA